MAATSDQSREESNCRKARQEMVSFSEQMLADLVCGGAAGLMISEQDPFLPSLWTSLEDAADITAASTTTRSTSLEWEEKLTTFSLEAWNQEQQKGSEDMYLAQLINDDELWGDEEPNGGESGGSVDPEQFLNWYPTGHESEEEAAAPTKNGTENKEDILALAMSQAGIGSTDGEADIKEDKPPELPAKRARVTKPMDPNFVRSDSLNFTAKEYVRSKDRPLPYEMRKAREAAAAAKKKE